MKGYRKLPIDAVGEYLEYRPDNMDDRRAIEKIVGMEAPRLCLASGCPPVAEDPFAALVRERMDCGSKSGEEAKGDE